MAKKISKQKRKKKKQPLTKWVQFRVHPKPWTQFVNAVEREGKTTSEVMRWLIGVYTKHERRKRDDR